ncbi:hypothetical protein MXZ42_005177, partial [Salmonella enterica]|nr:hypothetical protein [Salmonella enterica]
IGDSDSGFIGSADGVLDIYCNNAKVGYIDNAGLHMLAGIATNNDLVLQSDERRHIMMQNADGSVRAYIYKDKGGDGIHVNNADDGGGEFVFNKNGEFYSPSKIHAGDAILANDGNVNGPVWGGWLNDFLNNNYNRKNTASLGGYGWVRDESTGFIMQWGTLNSSNGTYNFPRAFPVACLAVFVTNTSSQGALVDNAFGYPVNNSQFFAATKASNSAGIGAYPVAFFAIGR